MAPNLTRRSFLRRAGGTAAALPLVGYFGSPARADSPSPNEKLNVACIGVAHRGAANVGGVAGENVVALCDVDQNYLAKAAAKFPQAIGYRDYRRLFERRDLDAVVISTADHHHAPATLMALRRGLHVYCEKPLTHTVAEARRVAKLAAEQRVATQMGTQIHAEENYRRVVELIRAGAIGRVRAVHCWVAKAWGGGERPAGSDAVPTNLDWDLWLGPAPRRPYATGRYHPGEWRRWWDFGGGTLGDMACHVLDLPFWALELRHPTKVRAAGPPVHAETCPLGIHVQWEFARATSGRSKSEASDADTSETAAKSAEPLVLHWYDGNQAPTQLVGDLLGVAQPPGLGVLFIGEAGQLFADYSHYRLLPEQQFADFVPPAKSIPPSVGHHREWIDACKTGSSTTCNFAYSGALTEAVLLGNVAYRAGEEIVWDPATMQVTNSPAATALVSKPYRDGWEM